MAKPSVVAFLITLMFAAVVCIQGTEPVLDTDGNQVIAGAKYLIQPVETASFNGGGLVPNGVNLLPLCPLGITQTLFPDQPGVPVTFNIPKTVQTSSDVNIEFQSDVWPICKDFSKLWEVNVTTAAEPAILVGGKPEDANSKFQIEKTGNGEYKLTTSGGSLGTIDTWFHEPQLVLTNDGTKTITVKFRKVDDATMATTSTSI